MNSVTLTNAWNEVLNETLPNEADVNMLKLQECQ